MKSDESLVSFLGGALTIAYALAGIYFARFWRRTRDRLFRNFTFAFWLLAANQTLVTLLDASDERVGYAYLLRILGFVVILSAVLEKNVKTR